MSRLHVTAIAIRGNSTFATSQNAAPAMTSRKATSQSAAPATKKRRACIDTLPKYCACHAKHENDLTFCDLGAPKRAFRARLPPLFILWKTGWCRSANVPPNGSELTSWRRRGDDDTTTRQQNKANTGPTPDPNYKREPFATHSGKKRLKFSDVLNYRPTDKMRTTCFERYWFFSEILYVVVPMATTFSIFWMNWYVQSIHVKNCSTDSSLS